MSYFFFFFKQKTAYEMRISDWSSDVCSSDLAESCCDALFHECRRTIFLKRKKVTCTRFRQHQTCPGPGRRSPGTSRSNRQLSAGRAWRDPHCRKVRVSCCQSHVRSEEHTSELQSLMRISYAVFCLKKKTK